MITARWITLVLLCCMFWACDGRDTPKSKQAATITQDEKACLRAIKKEQSEFIIASTKRFIEALKAGQSTIPLTLEQRRMEEMLCLEELDCYKSKDQRQLGILFDSCLDPTEPDDG